MPSGVLTLERCGDGRKEGEPRMSDADRGNGHIKNCSGAAYHATCRAVRMEGGGRDINVTVRPDPGTLLFCTDHRA